MRTAVREAHEEVRCLEDFAQNDSRPETVLLLAEDSSRRSQLREEFGYRIREAGPVAEFGFQVVSKLRHDGKLDGLPLAYVGEVSREDLPSVESRPRLAVLDVSAQGCACVAGPVCAEAARSHRR